MASPITSMKGMIHRSWNMVRGCTPISPGCDQCYARAQHKAMYSEREHYLIPFSEVTFMPSNISIGHNYIISVNGISDTLHPDITDQQVQFMIDAISKKHGIFVVCTKRPFRASMFDWPPNVWLGTSIEDKNYLYRIDELLKANSKIKFVSFEPMLGPMGEVDLTGIDWVCMGIERGPQARPYRIQWLRQVRDHCIYQGVPLFYRGAHYTRNLRPSDLLDGKIWHQYPCGLEAKDEKYDGKVNRRKSSIQD